MNIILSLMVILTTTFLNLHAKNFEEKTTLTDKKILKMYHKGEKIFHKACKKNTDIKNYKKLNQCQPLSNKQKQSLFIYLSTEKKNHDTIKITKDDKCPICGMFVYKYKKWAAQIYYEDTHYTFDGVKDMMKYYFMHIDNISKILVTDYYSQDVINAYKAYFVVGSDVYGPMGDELIPFKNKSEAEVFSADHKALKILKFSDIKKKEVYKLDE